MWNKVPKREYIRGNGYAPKKNPDKIINDGVIYNPMGQWKHPGEVTKIPGNTMATHGYGNIPLWVVPDNDPARLVQPNSGQQVFPNSTNFTEYPQLPIAQRGGVLLPGAQGRWLDSVNAQFNRQYGGDPSIPDLNQMKKGGWLDAYSKQTKLRGNRGYTSKNIKTSINKLMLRNETLFGPKGKKIYDPLSKFQPGGATLPKNDATHFYTSDINDPRFQAQRDSINSNLESIEKIRQDVIRYTNRINNENKLNGFFDTDSTLELEPFSNSSGTGMHFWNNRGGVRRIVASDIIKPKPTQQVIYQPKPAVKPTIATQVTKKAAVKPVVKPAVADSSVVKQTQAPAVIKSGKTKYQTSGGGKNYYNVNGNWVNKVEYNKSKSTEIDRKTGMPIKQMGGMQKFQPGGAYNMERALELGYTPDETSHWPSVDSDTGMWLKSKEHPTAWMEYMYGHALNPELNKNTDVIINPEGYFGNNQLQYVPKKQMGGGLNKFQEGGWEQSISKFLGDPMSKAAKAADYKRPAVDPRTRRQHEAEPVDNVRHASGGRYTAEAIRDYAKLIPFLNNIPGLAEAAGFVGSNALGLGHEISSLYNDKEFDTRPWGLKLKESAADAYNNMVGSSIGLSNLSPYEKKAYIRHLSETGKIPTGQYNKKKDPIYKKQMGGWLDKYQTAGPVWQDEGSKNLKPKAKFVPRMEPITMDTSGFQKDETAQILPSKYKSAEQNKAAVKTAIEGRAETAYNKHLQREELKKKYPTKNQEEIQRIQDKIESPLFYEPAGQLASYATRFHGLTDDEIARITGSGTMGDRLGVAANMAAWGIADELGGKLIGKGLEYASPYIKQGLGYVGGKLAKYLPKKINPVVGEQLQRLEGLGPLPPPPTYEQYAASNLDPVPREMYLRFNGLGRGNNASYTVPDINSPSSWANIYDDVSPNIFTSNIRKPVNKSGLTKEEVLSKASTKDKEALSNMSELEFQETVMKPTGEVVPYKQGPEITQMGYNSDLRGMQLKNAVPMTPLEYSNAFNEKIDLLNDIIAQKNTSGLEYKVKELNPQGGLIFETPSMPGADRMWQTQINPGEWRGNIEDIANAEYYKSIPGLNMSNTSNSVFGDARVRRGSGTYEAINEYLKKLDLGRVKPGFNSQTEFSKGLWENAINKGKAFGYYNNPHTVYGAMKSVAPYAIPTAVGAVALNQKKLGGQNNWLEQYQEGGDVYKIKAGDSLSKIAKKYQTTVAELQKVNKIKNANLIVAGKSLIIPKPPSVDKKLVPPVNNPTDVIRPTTNQKLDEQLPLTPVGVMPGVKTEEQKTFYNVPADTFKPDTVYSSYIKQETGDKDLPYVYTLGSSIPELTTPTFAGSHTDDKWGADNLGINTEGTIPKLKIQAKVQGPNIYRESGASCIGANGKIEEECTSGMQLALDYNTTVKGEDRKKLGITGDGWSIGENVVNAGGNRYYSLTDTDFDRNSLHNNRDVKNYLDKNKKKLKLNNKAIAEQAEVGDIVEMWYQNSPSQDKALNRGAGNTVTTHAGIITEKNGKKYVTHNVHGTWHSDLLNKSFDKHKLHGGGSSIMIAGLVRPDYSDNKTALETTGIQVNPNAKFYSKEDASSYRNTKETKWKTETPVGKESQEFNKGLAYYAPKVQQDFGLTDKETEQLMKLTFGLFGKESGFGKGEKYIKKEKRRKFIKLYKDVAPDWAPEGDEMSAGKTQIKVDTVFDTPEKKALLAKYGITKDNIWDTENSAAAGLLSAAINYKKLKDFSGATYDNMDPLTLQNILALAHNKGMDAVIKNEFTDRDKRTVGEKVGKLLKGQSDWRNNWDAEPYANIETKLKGFDTYSKLHLDSGSYSNLVADYAASLNVDYNKIKLIHEDPDNFVSRTDINPNTIIDDQIEADIKKVRYVQGAVDDKVDKAKSYVRKGKKVLKKGARKTRQLVQRPKAWLNKYI